jgi:hypothetical protein
MAIEQQRYERQLKAALDRHTFQASLFPHSTPRLLEIYPMGALAFTDDNKRIPFDARKLTEHLFGGRIQVNGPPPRLAIQQDQKIAIKIDVIPFQGQYLAAATAC